MTPSNVCFNTCWVHFAKRAVGWYGREDFVSGGPLQGSAALVVEGVLKLCYKGRGG